MEDHCSQLGRKPSPIFAEYDVNGYYYFKSQKTDTNEGAVLKFSQTEAIAAILNNLQKLATQKLGKEVKGACIVLPSFAGHEYRRIVLQAAEIAGFQRARLINQTSAIALEYWRKETERNNYAQDQTKM